MTIKIERVEADVLCVGGGIAGLMAAIRASELGARVVVAEKGNSRYSGAGGAGNDHYWCYIPEVHGSDIDSYIKECMLGQQGGKAWLGPTILRTWMEKSFHIVQLWDQWGIPMKYNGKWEFAGHAFPGRVLSHLKYSGKNQKKVLTAEALKRGTEIMNRIMVFELLGSADCVTGALGIDTREDRLVEFQAKSVILGTGALRRMYPGITPALIGNDTSPITIAGDGRAMAYRLGAELVNMQMIGRHVGIRYFARSGQATWIGVYRDPQGRPLGPYVTKPEKRYGDMLPEVDKQIFSRIFESGRGPVYMDCTGISDKDLEYMTHWLSQEGNEALVKHLNEEGIDLRKNPVEFMTYGIRGLGEIYANERAETSVKGLYSAGDESFGNITGASVFGWIAGDNAFAYAKERTSPSLDKEKLKIEETKSLIDELQNRKRGSDWHDANIALQQIMYDYAGLVRSQSMLEAGASHLRRLREKVRNTVRAKNQWELTRCLEVLNLYDLGELIFDAALDRKESRGLHRRVDYSLTDPLLNDKTHIVKKVDQKPVFEWRESGR
jgi:succinate dehydrogenase/fumarate reductase flavoprotein subunit